MKTRTISVFRAHYNVRLDELAEKLEMEKDELSAIDEVSPVPQEIAEKIVSAYNLLPFYFTEDLEYNDTAKPIKKTPKNPFWYFFKVSLVSTLVISFAIAISTFVIGLLSFLIADSTEIIDIIAPIILRVAALVLGLGSCIFVSKYILNTTTLSGKIPQYKYLWYILPNALMLVPNLITTYWAENYGHSLDAGYNPVANVINALGGLVILLVTVALQARIFVIALEEDLEKQNKKISTIAIFSIVSYVVYYIIRVAFIPFGDAQNWIGSIITAVFTVAVAIGLLVKGKLNEKADKLIYTVLPVIAIIGSDIFSIICTLIK